MILKGQILLDNAFLIAQIAHGGQKRLGGADYIEHPMQVERLFASTYGNIPEGRALALLHDTMEDDARVVYTLQELIDGGFESIENELSLMTRPRGVSYLDYLLRIRQYSREYPLALQVKLCDLAANLATVDQVQHPIRVKTMRTKWEMAQWILNANLTQ